MINIENENLFQQRIVGNDHRTANRNYSLKLFHLKRFFLKIWDSFLWRHTKQAAKVVFHSKSYSWSVCSSSHLSVSDSILLFICRVPTRGPKLINDFEAETAASGFCCWSKLMFWTPQNISASYFNCWSEYGFATKLYLPVGLWRLLWRHDKFHCCLAAGFRCFGLETTASVKRLAASYFGCVSKYRFVV